MYFFPGGVVGTEKVLGVIRTSNIKLMYFGHILGLYMVYIFEILYLNLKFHLATNKI